MRLSRSKNAKGNILHGFINKIVLLLLPFWVRTTIIHVLGINYLGINGVFSSILSVLSLAELGVGSAIVFSLYSPIAENDKDTICAYMNYYKSAYRRIGGVILLLGLCIMPFIRLFIHDDVPVGINLYLLFALYLIKSALSYFLFAYKSAILTAFQRNDVISTFSTICCLFTSVLQIFLLYIIPNFYIYMIVAIIFTMISNVLVSIYTNMVYPDYVCRGQLDDLHKEMVRKRVIGLLIGKISGVSRNAFDNVFISMFIGLGMAGIYSNYYYIMNAIVGIMAIIPPALQAGVGNSIQLDSVEKNLNDMRRINFAYMVMSGWCAVCLLCLYQPFMYIWVGAEYMFPIDAVVLFVVYFYIKQMGNIRAMYSDAAGLFWENRYRNIAEAICNPILNYLFVIKWGINGIIGATIITLFFFGVIASAEVLFRCYFKSGLAQYLIDNAKNVVITIIVAFITYCICGFIGDKSFIGILLRLIICCTICPIIFLTLYFKMSIFRDTVTWLRRILVLEGHRKN